MRLCLKNVTSVLNIAVYTTNALVYSHYKILVVSNPKTQRHALDRLINYIMIDDVTLFLAHLSTKCSW